MTSITWTTAASTDLLGRDGVDVRAGGPTMAGRAARHEGTGLPIAACTGVQPATGVAGGTADTGTPRIASAFDRRPKSLRTAEHFPVSTYLPQNDGTTLGIRSPGRPLS
ncbi:hypothetical protein [Blastococcus saxobsidens]|uniref:Uncharacterized protein n=1 Tax=Blastococcus saxobsidens (strain DD2) TaxID=1146883 RepID=H6RK18_BLASD|nr:hypothetical protein [Blastococcus saxobsidens]CCG04874.1 protein of unknown function [Blastococcus saxobsidens DD2]